MMRITSKYVVLILLVLLLAACQPSTATPAPTQAGGQVQLPVVSGENNTGEGYPPAVSPPTVEQGYPGAIVEQSSMVESYPGPSGMPAIDNRSKVVAQLLEQKAGPSPDQAILRVRVISSEVMNNMPEFTSQLINQEADLVVTLAGLPALAPGDQFQAEVIYRGDENGGRYYAEKVEKR